MQCPARVRPHAAAILVDFPQCSLVQASRWRDSPAMIIAACAVGGSNPSLPGPLALSSAARSVGGLRLAEKIPSAHGQLGVGG